MNGNGNGTGTGTGYGNMYYIDNSDRPYSLAEVREIARTRGPVRCYDASGFLVCVVMRDGAVIR